MGAVAVDAPQHLRALESANKVRLDRARLKRRLGAGELTVGTVLADVPAEARNMAVMELLCAPKRWGRERARRTLLKAGALDQPIHEHKPVGELTPRQRDAIAAITG